MANNKHISDNNQSTDKLATDTSLEKSSLNLSESNMDSNKKQRDHKPSLMSRLRNISIEGPEDFAANHDLYISGEKRIEPDIH